MMQLFEIHGAMYTADIEDEEFLSFQCAAHIVDGFSIRIDEPQSSKDDGICSVVARGDFGCKFLLTS